MPKCIKIIVGKQFSSYKILIVILQVKKITFLIKKLLLIDLDNFLRVIGISKTLFSTFL